ncbi:hypothetical protein CI109_100557 [Kwoniella shandongensis]|uniref:Uncharacterized protein n=1 Tax=Kwoniella shandongensis TaxID=1734106 RepID=A0A5M6BZR4_9TREE|nr:uncharacterized protein CI109_003522 [Kwoniella shandongensis]KAA5528233.1 hypothetical protein CI109_003522 [Kwoniella shandongensis]
MSFFQILRMVFPPKPEWSVDQIPDLTGKVALVTGGNSGIGKEVVHQLLLKNAKVYLGARSPEKAEQAIEELAQLTDGKKALFLHVDMADMDSVKAAAKTFMEQEQRLDLLFNNAGVLLSETGKASVQGYELTFATNTLSPYLFTKLLLPVLRRTASSTAIPPRVVWTISAAPFFLKGDKLQYDLFKLEKRLDGDQTYCQSKTAATMLAQYLGSTETRPKNESGEVWFVSLDPGAIKTDLFKEQSSLRVWFQDRFLVNTIPMGALTPLYAGTSPVVQNGQTFFPFARLGFPAKVTTNVEEQKKLADWCDKEIAQWL